MLFHVTPKCDYLQHFPEQSSLCNPRYTPTYLEEGLIGKVAAIYGGSAHGESLERIGRTVLIQLLTVMQLRFSVCPIFR